MGWDPCGVGPKLETLFANDDSPPDPRVGDVAVVLNRSIVDGSAVLSPIDSGDYSISCHGTFSADFCALWSSNETACKEFWYCAYSATGADGEAGDEGAGAGGAGGGQGVQVGVCSRNEPLLSGRECSVLKNQDEEHAHSYREVRHECHQRMTRAPSSRLPRQHLALPPPPAQQLGVPGALDHIFIPFADYYGPSMAPERLAVRVTHHTTTRPSPPTQPRTVPRAL